MRFLIYLFVILVIGGYLIFNWYDYRYDFLISFIINLFNTVIAYLVSKKYFNSDNSTFYKMTYGTMFLRFVVMLSLILVLINGEYVRMIPFFMSFMIFYVLFQVIEITFLIQLNKERR